MPKPKMLQAALKYRELGYSVVPVSVKKKSLVPWARWQSEIPSEDQIAAWWRDYPEANVAIVTGSVSGITVIDIDTAEGSEVIEDLSPDSMVCPTALSPRGKHLYFRHCPGIANKARSLAGCDVRNDGGYIIAPPSRNGRGTYQWAPGLKITDVPLSGMPDMLQSILLEGSPNKIGSISSSIGPNRKVRNVSECQDCQERVVSFTEGGRDDTLFYLANHLFRSGMPEVNVRKYVEFYAAHCDPPFDADEAENKILSALRRDCKRHSNLAGELREYINLTLADIDLTSIRQIFKIADKTDILNLYKIMSRFCDENIIERVKGRRGVYRKIEADCKPVDWLNATEPIAKLWLPWDLDLYARIPHGGLVLIAGEANSGKTAAALNIVRENMRTWDVHYFSSEISAGMFKRRLAKFPDIMPEQWRVKFYERTSDFHDIIKATTSNKSLYIIDYVEIYDSFWKIGEILADVHRALNGGVAVANIQKGKGKEHGLGGDFTAFKPSLVLSVRPNITRCTKLKEWNDDRENINHMEFRWKLVDGCRFLRQQGWHRPEEVA